MPAMEGLRIASFALGILVILGFVALRGYSIKCYECNSAYDPRCGDPFDDYSIGTVDCDLKPKPTHLEHVNATLCRKTVQKIYGKVRHVRTCGYIGEVTSEDGKRCISRSGTYEVSVSYCACKGDFCNAATSREISELLLFLVAIVTFRKVTAVL